MNAISPVLRQRLLSTGALLGFSSLLEGEREDWFQIAAAAVANRNASLEVQTSPPTLSVSAVMPVPSLSPRPFG